MLKNIIKGYSQLLVSILKVLVLLVLCVAIGAAFVYPLWMFATKLPQTYTAVVLLIILILLSIMAFNKARNAGLKATLLFTAKFAVIVAGISASVILVLEGMRFYAIPVIIAVLIVYGILAFYTKPQTSLVSEDETA